MPMDLAQLMRDSAEHTKQILRLGARMNQVPFVPRGQAFTAAIGADSWCADVTVRKDGLRLDLGFVTFAHFEAGFPALVDYLGKLGCRDFRIALSDFDDVRGD